MEEVRVKRGLAYSVSSSMSSLRHVSILRGSLATRNDTVGQSLEIVRDELKKMADGDIDERELDSAKNYLIGSYALRFDTNAKIAAQLLGLLAEELGPDYVDRRSDLVAAVTLDALKRVAKRLLDPSKLIVTVVGRPALAPSHGVLGPSTGEVATPS
jgi:zinc protease